MRETEGERERKGEHERERQRERESKSEREGERERERETDASRCWRKHTSEQQTAMEQCHCLSKKMPRKPEYLKLVILLSHAEKIQRDHRLN